MIPERIQVTNLTQEQKDLVLDAARLRRMTIREWVLFHAQADMTAPVRA